MAICIFEEEGILIMGMGGEIADGLYAEYSHSHIVRCIVLVKQILVLTVLVDQIELLLIVETLVEVIHNVLDHHYL